MNYISKFNEIRQSKNITEYSTTVRVNQYNERPIWTVEIKAIDVEGLVMSGSGSCTTKTGAEQIACKELLNSKVTQEFKDKIASCKNKLNAIKNRVETVKQDVDKDLDNLVLEIGKVELTMAFEDTIPTNEVEFLYSEGDVHKFRYKERNYEFPADDVKIGKEKITLSFNSKKDQDDFSGRITRAGLNNPKVKKALQVSVKSYVPSANLKVHYSNHRNFDPMLRVVIKLKSQVLDEWSGESEGHLRKFGSIICAPKNIMRVHFQGSVYMGDKIPLSLYSQVLNSVKKQTLTVDDLYLMAAQLASIKMFNLETKDLKSSLAVFYKIYFLMVEYLNQNRNLIVNYDEAWEYLRNVKLERNICIPTKIVYYGKVVELFTNKCSISDLPSFDDLRNHVTFMAQRLESKTREEVLENFSSGLMDLLSEEYRDLKFDFATNVVPKNMCMKSLTLSEQEKFMSDFIFEQCFEPNVALCFKVALGKNMHLFDTIMDRLSLFSFSGLWHNTLSDKFKDLPFIDLESLDNNALLNLIVSEQIQYKHFAQRAQLVAQVWANILHFDRLQQVFNSLDFVREIIKRKTFSSENTIFESIKKSFVEAKTTFSSVMNAGKESSTMWEANKNRLSELLKKLEAPLSHTMANTDFSTFSNSLASCKMLVTQFFNEAVRKVAAMLNIEYEPPKHLDIANFLFYYLVWKDTNNLGIKIMILVDVLTTLGVVDYFFSFLKKLWNFTQQLGSKVWSVVYTTQDTMDDSVLDQVLEEMKKHTDKNNASAAEHFKSVDEDNQQPYEDIGFIQKILNYLEKGTPYFLGVAATLLLSSFACSSKIINLDKCSFSEYGKEIIATARSLSFLGAGLAAFPKIYINFLAAFKWVIDQVKGLVIKDHITSYEVNCRAEKWITETAFYSGNVCYAFTSSPETCLNYLAKYKEMLDLKPLQLRMSKELSFAFTQRVKIFELFFERVRTIMYESFSLEEMFHVQLWGAPGVGKTDLSDALMRELKDAFSQSQVDFGQVAGGSAMHVMSLLEKTKTGLGDVYHMNETLKHLDGFQGHNFIRLDDCNLFCNPDQDAVTTMILMISGTATLANKAELADKGMVITAKGMISCTNVPFPMVDNMWEPEALHRRRHLFKVEPAAAFLDARGNMLIGDALNAKFAELGLNRTRGDHIRVTPLHPTDTKEIPLNPKLVNMTVDQTKKYIRHLALNHYASELNRSFTKDPVSATIKLKYEALLKSLTDQTEENLTKCEFNTVLSNLLEGIKKKRNEHAITLHKKNAVFKDEDVWSDKLENHYKETLTVYADVCHNYDQIEIMDSYGTLAHLVDALDENTVLPPSAAKIFTTNVNGEVEMKETFNEFSFDSKDEGLDFVTYSSQAKKFVSTLKDDDNRYTDENFSLRLYKNLAYLNSLSKLQADIYLDKHRRLTSPATLSCLEKIKIDFKYALMISARATGKALKCLMDAVVTFIGKPLVTGFCVAMGLMGLFFSCSMIGQMLAPTNTSYNSKGKPLTIQGLQHTFKVEQNEEIEVDGHFLSHAQSAEKNTLIVRVGGTKFVAIGLVGNLFLINYHAATTIDKNMEAEIFDVCTQQTKIQPLGPQDWFRVTQRNGLLTDGAIIRFSNIRAQRDITNRFLTEHDLASNMENLRTSCAIPVIWRDDKFVEKKAYPLLRVNPNTKAMEHERIFAIQFYVNRGESGSLFYHDNSKLQGKILGIQLARDFTETYAYIGVFSQEEIKTTILKFPQRDRISVNLIETPELKEGHVLATVFKYGQTVKESCFPPQSISKSLGFKPTPVYGLFPVETVPAIQSEFDPRWDSSTRHFLEVSLNKSSGNHFARFDNEEEKFMKRFYESVLISCTQDIAQVKLYSTQQAIMGTKIPGSCSMDLQNCAGLPYKLERGVQGKSPFITRDSSGTYNIQERVFNDIALCKSAYINGVVPPTIMLEFRKKELVQPAKIENPKTRTVGMGNFIHQIIFMEIFKDLHTMLKVVWSKGGSMPFALGVDPEQHWDQIAKHLRYHDYMIDMDVKAWEEKINQRLLFMCDDVELKVIREAYQTRGDYFPPETEKIAHGLSVAYTHCDVAVEDILYEKTAGLLSGHPGTFMRNSAVHCMIIGLAARRILKKFAPQYATIPFIMEHVRYILAADDVVIAISPLARKYITTENLVKAYNEIGFEVTAADKGTTIKEKTIKDIQFLKHKFRLDEDGCFKCIPNLSIIYQLVNWYRTDTSVAKDKLMSDNFDTALRFAWHRGRDEYEDIRTKLNNAAKRVKMNYVYTLDYDEMADVRKFSHLMKKREIFSPYPQQEETDYDYVY